MMFSWQGGRAFGFVGFDRHGASGSPGTVLRAFVSRFLLRRAYTSRGTGTVELSFPQGHSKASMRGDEVECRETALRW